MIKISGTIITYNEEKHIERCIRSMIDVTDEIVVVDSFSTDRTKEICAELGKTLNIRFFEHPFEGHIEQKNFAKNLTSYDYILSLDADEALNDVLRSEIASIKQDTKYQAYSFNRLTSYCGKWIHHCGWYPDKKLRLFHKECGEWGGENPHDRVLVKEGIPTFHIKKGDLLHYSFLSIAQHANTANTFSETAAREALAKGKKASFLIHVLFNPLYTFIKKYFFQRGFLDGYYGFIICILSAHSNFLKYSKIWYAKHSHK